MDTVNRNYLIKLDNAKQAGEVFDVLRALGEPTNEHHFIYNNNWCHVGFYTNDDKWTIADKSSDFGSNVISFENFMKTFSSKDSVNKLEESSTEVDIKAIQEECKKRFPIGCTYQDPGGKTARVLRQDHSTYHIYGDKHIYAHEDGGCLYEDGEYATLVSFPEEKPFKSRFKIGDWIMWDSKHSKAGPYKLTSISGTGFLDQNDEYRGTEDSNYRLATKSEIPEKMLDRDIPEYVECMSDTFSAIKLGKIYKLESRSTNHSYWIKDVDLCSYSSHHFKASTKEAYDAQFTTKSVKEWETGTYAVGIKGNFGVYSGDTNKIPIGKVYTISRGDSISGNNVGVKESSFWIKKENLKWFATKEEAESFASTLTKTEPIYAYVGDPLPKTKPLIEDVQSVSVNLRTKKNNNKFKF